MSRPTVTVISPKGEAGSETIAVPNVFKVSRCETLAARTPADRTRCKIRGTGKERTRVQNLQLATTPRDSQSEYLRCAAGCKSMASLVAELVANEFAGAHPP